MFAAIALFTVSLMPAILVDQYHKGNLPPVENSAKVEYVKADNGNYFYAKYVK